VSSEILKIPASSIVSIPTIRSGVSNFGIPDSSPDSLSGGSLPAQPAQGEKSSSLTESATARTFLSARLGTPSFRQAVGSPVPECAAMQEAQSP